MKNKDNNIKINFYDLNKKLLNKKVNIDFKYML